MKKLFLILFLAAPCFSSGPKYDYKDPLLDDELLNVYKGIDNVFKSTAPYIRASTITVTNLNVSNITGLNLGKVRQVKYANASVETTTTSTGFSNTGLLVSITPTSATSTILIFVFQTVGAVLTTAANAGQVSIQLMRGATKINGPDPTSFFTSIANNAEIAFSWANVYQDNPATISSTTYQTQFARGPDSNAVTHKVQPHSALSTIVAVELAP